MAPNSKFKILSLSKDHTGITSSCSTQSTQKDAWKAELKDFSNKNGYEISRNGDSGPLLLDVLEGFLKFEGCHGKCNVLCSKRFRFKYLFAQQRSLQEIGETELGPHTSGNVRGLVARKRLAQAQAEKALSMIKGVLDYSEFRDVNMVIEAVIENVPLKQKIFSELEKVCPLIAFGLPMGPFQLQDLAGYGVAVAVGKEFAKAFPDRTFRSPITDLMIKSGRNGKNNGKGYYIYEKGSKPKPDPQVFPILEEARRQVNIMPGGKPINITDQEVVEMILFAVVNEACQVEKLLSIFSYKYLQLQLNQWRLLYIQLDFTKWMS
ncbi:putative isomerase, 3-hydroxyacyl-CoA dehydrogenase, Enoyl-CoA hydratase [Helianthus annuus]|nr:putative isomerase, 3-hydroxyacyl-CoA dehydrogenase, Enoyl-CoA hydratase [Helianthus annuus]